MLSFLAPYKLYIEIAAVLAIVAGISYGVHNLLAHERKLGYNIAVAEYTEKALAAAKEARAREIVLNTQVQEARNVAILREQQIVDLSARLSVTSNSLLDTINALRHKLSTDPADTARKRADTALTLLGECQKRYGEVAESADRHASDVKLLQDAWPR